jgi:hypothetical protein
LEPIASLISFGSRSHPAILSPLQLRDPELNQLATDPLSLLEYDAFIVEARPGFFDPLRELVSGRI